MKALRVALCVVFATSVLAFGGVEIWGISLLETAAGVLFVFWAVLALRDPAAKIEWSPLNWPFLAFIALGVLQLVFRATAYPFLTRVELLKLAAYFLIFFLTAQAFRTRTDFVRLTWFVVGLCFVVSVFAIVQHFTSQGEIYWTDLFKVEADPFGPYVNRNHFAGFVELTLPAGLALMAFRGVRKDLLPLTAVLTIVPIGAMVLSGSRAGIVSFAVEIGVLALLVRSRRGLGWKGPGALAAGALALLAITFIAWLGADRAIQRFSVLNVHEVSMNRRVSMARGAAHIFEHYPIKGCGLGTLVDVYPRYETLYDGKLVDHVHDDYMETLAETGLLGGLCGAIFLWLIFREARKNFTAEQGHFSRALHAGAIVAVSGILVHSFADFNLHIPANVLLFLLQVSLVTSPPLPSEGPIIRKRHREAMAV